MVGTRSRSQRVGQWLQQSFDFAWSPKTGGIWMTSCYHWLHCFPVGVGIASEVWSLQGPEAWRGVLHLLDRMPGANGAHGAKVKMAKTFRCCEFQLETLGKCRFYLSLLETLGNSKLKEARHLFSRPVWLPIIIPEVKGYILQTADAWQQAHKCFGN